MQIHIFVNALIVPDIQTVTLNGKNASWVPEADENRAWIRILNLHYIDSEVAQVRIRVARPMNLDELCSGTPVVAESNMCEYVLRGNYDNAWNGLDDWRCCPHGATPVEAMSCPAP